MHLDGTMTSDHNKEAEIPADTVYILAKQSHKVSHNTRVEWFIGNINRRVVFPAGGISAQLSDRLNDCEPADWSSLSIVSASPAPTVANFPLTYLIQPHTTVKYLAHSYRITFVLDLSESMLQPCCTGFSTLHHALVSIETVLYKLIPHSSCLPLPLPNSYLYPLSIFVSIIGVVPNRQSYTFIHDWEASQEGVKSMICLVSQRLFQLELSGLLTKCESSPESALVDMLRHGVLTLAMQMPDWAPASLIIVSDACFTTLNMTELDYSLAHLRAAAIRCSFIIPSPYGSSSLEENYSLRHLLRTIASSPCIPHVDLCQFIAHATAGFCLTGLSEDWECLSKQTSSHWNLIHELLLALRLQDDIESTPEKEGDLGWMAIKEIQPYSCIVRAALTHVLASRLKDGYRLRSVSLGPVDQEFISESVPSPSPWIQIELALAWKPGVIFRLFLAGQWFLPTGQLPISSSSSDFLLKNGSTKSNRPLIPGRYCVANLRVRANCSLLRAFTQQRRDQVISPYLASILNQYDFHLKLLTRVDYYLENVSSFNLDPDIYTVPNRYKNGLCSVFITAQGASGASEIYLSGNAAEEVEHDKSLFTFVHYWGELLTLDIANCYRWMHSETIYVVLEHDSPLPANLFVPVQTRRVPDSLTCRQSLARIHSMLSDWCTFVLLENHTYIRLEYLNHESLEDSTSPDTPDSGPLHHVASSTSVPCYFTLVRLEMRLPEMRVRVAFTAGVQSDYRRATLEQLSRRFRVLSFLPRGRQAVPKSRHKSGAPVPLIYPPPVATHTETVHVPPLQRTWGETPCCMVFLSQLDRLIVESGTWLSCRQLNYHSSLPSTSNFQPSKSFLKATVTEARCEVAPSLLRQHLCTLGRIWVVPVLAKSPNCITKMFSTLMNLRIQEGFHFVRSGPQPGFLSMAREIMFSVDSAAEGAVKQPCLIQYQLYPFRVKSSRNDHSDEPHDILIASESVLREIGNVDRKNKFSKVYINRLKALTSSQYSSEIQIATEVWIEPKHGLSTDLPTEALYLANLQYSDVVERILQLDCFCLSAYSTLEKMLTICLLRMIELQRLATPLTSTSNENYAVSAETSSTTTNSSSSNLPASTLPFNLANIASVSPRVYLLYPLLLDASSTPNTVTGLRYISMENIMSHLVFNLTQRMPYIAPIPLTVEDSNQFSRFLISEETEEIASILNRTLSESDDVSWQCFAATSSLLDTMSSGGGIAKENTADNGSGFPRSPLENLVEASSVEIAASPVTFFILPANMKSAMSPFCQYLLNNLRQRGQTIGQPETSFPIFIYSCTHTYLSFPLDDRWTYIHPETLVIDFFRQNQASTVVSAQSMRFIHYNELTTIPPESFLSAAKENDRLTKELVLLWSRLRDASLGLLNLCDEAFVECAHRTLLYGFTISETAMTRVLNTKQFCSSLPSITIDATDFLFSTCSHCYCVTRNQTDSQNPPVYINKKKYSDVCEIRPNDKERIRSRIFSVFNQYFAPIPQFQGFYYFRGDCDEATRSPNQRKAIHCCDTWPEPIPEPESQKCASTRKRSSEKSINQKVLFSTSSRSDSDADDVRKVGNECTSSKENVSEGSAYPNEISRLVHRRPLFMKVLATLKHGVEEFSIPVESLPICILTMLPDFIETDLQKIGLSVSFTPLIWKPAISTTSSEVLDHQEPSGIPVGHLDPVEEVNEPNSESSSHGNGSGSEEFSVFSEGDESLDVNVPRRPMLRPLSMHPSRRAASMSSELFIEDDNLYPLHWCECQLEVSEEAAPCSICKILCNSEFFCFLDNEQWLSLQRTAQLFRWLLQDEVICSQRLVQSLTVSSVEAVLRHMENTKSILLNIAPSCSSNTMPLRISHSHSRLSKACTDCEGCSQKQVSDALVNLMCAIGWESVDLEFIAKSEKSIPRFLEHLEAISFRYAQACLNRVGDYYVVCRVEPIRPLTSSPQECKKSECRQSPFKRSTSEADISNQIDMEHISPTGRSRRYGVFELMKTAEEENATSQSVPLSPTSQPAGSSK